MINQRLVFISLVSLSLLSPLAHALKPLNDHQLSDKTAQDGIIATVNLNGSATQDPGTITLDSIKLIDKDGFSTIAPGAGAASFNFAPGGIRLCAGATASSTCATVSEAVRLEIDAGSNAGSATARINIQTTAGSYFIPVQSVSLVGLETSSPGVLTKNALGRNIETQEVDVLEFASGGIAINMTSPLTANVELGNETQGAMIVIDPNTFDLVLGRMNFLSYDEATAGSTAAETSGGFDVSISGIDVPDGIAINVDGQTGLEANLGDISIASTNVNNISFGDVSPTSTANISTVDGLRNASIGNLSLTNASFKDVRVNISGL